MTMHLQKEPEKSAWFLEKKINQKIRNTNTSYKSVI